MDDLKPPSLGGCHGAELTERLGVWSKEIMRSAEALKDLGEHVAAGGNERLSEDLRLAATRLAEVEAERDALRSALDSIDVYGSDTLSGRVKPDPATYKAWLIEGIVEMRNRARAALEPKP